MKQSELPSELKQWLATPSLPELGPEPRKGTRPAPALAADVERFVRGAGLPPAKQDLVRSAVLLWHDHLEESHAISQGIHTRDGSFLHAIMHRREPDSSNSKYWWNRVGAHPCFVAIAERVHQWLSKSGQSGLAAQLLPRGAWDALAFVDACEQARGRGTSEEREWLKEIQRIEMEAFLEHVFASR